MKIDNLIILLIGFIWTRVYLYLIVMKGKGILISHSHSAKYYPKLFFFYIIGLVVPWAYVGYDLMTAVACSILFVISVVTGYNDNIRNNKLEDIIHVGAVWVAIAVSVVWILAFSLSYLLLVVPITLAIVYLTVKKVKNHTWWIEDLIEYMVYIVLFIERVL